MSRKSNKTTATAFEFDFDEGNTPQLKFSQFLGRMLQPRCFSPVRVSPKGPYNAEEALDTNVASRLSRKKPSAFKKNSKESTVKLDLMPGAAEEAANVEQNYCANNDDESTPNQNKKAKAVEEIPNSAKTVVETQKETESKVKEFLQLLVDYFSNVEQTSGSEKVAELTDSFASLVAKSYPNNFVAFLSIVVENGSMPAYLAAVKYAQEAMSIEVANEFLSYLANHFLRYIDNCRSSRAFDQFCRYFLEFAAVFPQVESTDFVSSFIVPTGSPIKNGHPLGSSGPSIAGSCRCDPFCTNETLFGGVRSKV